eukprot:2735559-Amphidinium_carterae.2
MEFIAKWISKASSSLSMLAAASTGAATAVSSRARPNARHRRYLRAGLRGSLAVSAGLTYQVRLQNLQVNVECFSEQREGPTHQDRDSSKFNWLGGLWRARRPRAPRLSSKPTNFLFVGNPGTGKSTILNGLT